jgi:hypothetical protein
VARKGNSLGEGMTKGSSVSENPNFTRLSPQAMLERCGQHSGRANEMPAVSDRDVTPSDLVEIAKRNGDFRKNYGVLVGAISALDKCSAASIILVASLVGSSRSCVWILVAMNNIGDSARGMNRWSVISLVS